MKKATGQSGRNLDLAAAPTGDVAPAEKTRRYQGICPIVGIGASAGGLEALEQFLRNVPAKCGLAFVIVQHLDPTRDGMMVELLQRGTPMPAVQVTDQMKVEPDRVYVIPRNRDLSLLNGVLHLLTPTAARGLRLPIDFFFRSLAEDCQERSIGVILSGMGSDGTSGLRAIKKKAGAAFVQDPASARFDGMPRSAIEADLADVVATAEELPGKIIAYLQHVPFPPRKVGELPETLRGTVMIVFKDLPTPTGRMGSGKREQTLVDNSQIAALQQEIQRLQQEQQSTREEMQVSQEELRSSNEELQSTNEELTTSKEEMQSMNEELQTVNHELQAKVEELSQASNDMKNLLNSTDIAILFLDDALRVRRFTSQTSKIIKLIPTDAGRPITDIVTMLDHPDLEEDAREVLRTLGYSEKQVASRDGQWYSVRIIPYRTYDNRIEGLVITFFDITAMKKLEAELRTVQAIQEKRYVEQTAKLGRFTDQLETGSRQEVAEPDSSAQGDGRSG